MHFHAGWLKLANFPLSNVGAIIRAGDDIYREWVHELSAGRYIHIIQTTDGFAGWPRRSFGSVTPCGPELAKAIADAVRTQSSQLRLKDGFKEGTSFWITGGWGSGRGFSASEDQFPPDWPLIPLDPSDILVLSACEDAKLSDLWRLEKLQELVARQGFEFSNPSGFLNMFRWWQISDHALVPENKINVTPPININFDTNLLLDLRIEAGEKLDRRTVLYPNGRLHLVTKLERGQMARAFGPVYGSVSAIQDGRLAGVALHRNSSWWVELTAHEEEKSADVFETWRAALLWASRIMPMFFNTVAKKINVSNLLFQFHLSGLPGPSNSLDNRSLGDHEIDAAVIMSSDKSSGAISIELTHNWHQGFYRPDNYAEASLAVAMLRGAAEVHGLSIENPALWDIVRSSTGSTDFRHRHAFEADSASDQLTSHGLAKGFKPIPVSASALAKCGSVWGMHRREDGVKFEGKEACIKFLQAFLEHIQIRFISAIQRFDRRALIVAGLEGMQSAIAEEEHWGRSARALRAIHGTESDFTQSLKTSVGANGVLRANSIIVEVASTDAKRVGGETVGRMDIEELQALALQLFLSGDILPAFYSDRIEPAIEISPTGDILYDHDFETTTLKVSAELRHARARESASRKYIERFSKSSPAASPDAELLKAISAEYGGSTQLFRDLPYALVEACESQGRGVVTLRRSALLTKLQDVKYLAGVNVAPMIDRLTLPSRNGWGDILPGTKASDFDLSKFDRRFSLIARSIVSLSAETDAELVIAPGVIERGFMHNIGGAISGALQNEFWQSTTMRAYASRSGARDGLEFNGSVAEAIAQLGLHTWPSAKPSWCLNSKKTEELERLGDIDVLAVSADGEIVWVVEAKDLKLCRTMGEAARRLSDYRGEYKRNGKPDELVKHLKRVAYLREHASGLVQRLNLSKPPRVHGILVVNAPQPMQQLHKEYSANSTVVMLERLDEVPWSTGWGEGHMVSRSEPFASPATG